MDTDITLVAVTYSTDTIGQTVRTKSVRTVLGYVDSISGSEWYEAGQSGMKASLRAVTPAINYDGELTVLIGGKTYEVYRTYRAGDDIELYLEYKAVDADATSN